jgi:hypothetical protein
VIVHLAAPSRCVRLTSNVRPQMRYLFTAIALVVAPVVHLSAQPLTPGSETPQVVSSSNADAHWRPTDVQASAVLSRTRAYFDARDTGKIEEAYAMFSPSQRATVPLTAWRNAIDAFNARAGAPRGRLVRKVTWYKDPPQRTGIYAAVDFSSQFDGLALHCGYVIWQAQSDGTFALAREEDNVIDRAMAKKLQPGQLEQIRAQFRC